MAGCSLSRSNQRADLHGERPIRQVPPSGEQGQSRHPATTGPTGLLPALPETGQDCAPNGLPTERGHQARDPVLVSTDRWLIELKPNRNGGW